MAYALYNLNLFTYTFLEWDARFVASSCEGEESHSGTRNGQQSWIISETCLVYVTYKKEALNFAKKLFILQHFNNLKKYNRANSRKLFAFRKKLEKIFSIIYDVGSDNLLPVTL